MDEPTGSPPLQPVPTRIIVQRQPEHVLQRFDTSVGVAVYWMTPEAAREVGQHLIDAANQEQPLHLVIADPSDVPGL